MLSAIIPKGGLEGLIFLLLFSLFLLTATFGIITGDLWIFALLPTIMLIGYILLLPIRNLYFLTFFLIPFSIETDLPGGFGFDFPTEGLLFLLTGIGIIFFIRQPRSVIFRGIGALFLLHFCWLLFSILWAENPLLSAKFLFAKIWYFVPFYVLPFYLVRNKADLSVILKLVLFAVLLAGSYTFIKHGVSGWSFATRTNAGAPIFRNHVNYACILLISLPICYYLYRVEKRSIYIFTSAILLLFLFFTYARIAYVAILLSIVSLIFLRSGYLKHFLGFGFTVSIIALSYFGTGDRLLHFAPDYQKTISHDEFGRLIDATYRLQDISSMERAHRWVAGLNIIIDRPWTGIGPANFSSSYQPFTVNSFQTYVSDNPEKSGIHNYFLMTAVEQGIPGLVILLSLFLFLIFAIIRLFQSGSPDQQVLFELILLWLVVIITINLLNDMFEVIKVGPFFFFAAFILQNIAQFNKESILK